MDSRAPNPDSPLRAALRKIELPWFILAALLLSTLFAAYQNSRQLRADTEVRFQEIVQSEQRAIVRQLRDVENLMHGAAALMTALPNLKQSGWDTYFDARIRDPEHYAGVIALQYLPASPVSSATGAESLTRVFVPSRPGQQVVALRAVSGVAAAIELVDRTGRMAISGPLDQVPGLPALQSPVAMVVATGTDGSVRSLASGAAPPRGYLIGIIDLNLMMGQLARHRVNPVTLELFDGDRRVYVPVDAMTAASAPEMAADVPIDIGQRTLRLRANSTPLLESKLQNNTPRTILLIGMLGTILLAGLIWLLTSLRAQAEALAASMTRKLQEQTTFTENLIEFNPSPIFRKDTDGRFVSVNRAWEQLAGRKREDILGKTYRDFQRADFAATNEALDQKLLASETGYEMAEAFITNAENKQFETIIAKQVLRASDGRAEGLIGTITDVTPIKRLERELAQQREQLDLVIRASQQGIWDVNLVPGGEYYFSARFREMLGFANGDFPAAADWQTIVHPDDLAAFRQHMVDHFKGETPWFDIESRLRAQSGEYLWVRARGIAQRDAVGRAVRFVGSIVDVTERKNAEMRLVEANVRVTQAARAKEAFLATMSHEIRTPLNGVLGMASLLSETTLNDEQRDYIRLIRASGDTLLRLIDDVLDFSKIESGHMTLESVPIEIVPVVEEAFELVADKAREKGLALLFDMKDDVPYYILGDATRLRQILLNLLANAIKFTAKGEIKLTLRAQRTHDGNLELEGQLRDTGIGIPADRAGKLFQPFTQVDASTTRKYGGTGLGLAICKRLTQLMGGDIRVESVEGEGSVFIFTIHTDVARGPLKPYMQRDVYDFAGKRLLVVDRNASRRPILLHRYRQWGFDAVAVAPEDAATVFRRGPPFDILVTDMVLPTPDAINLQTALEEDDAARALRGSPPVVSVLQSTISRAELSSRHIRPPLRHETFVVRPTGRARMFDVLMRAVLREPHLDVATRPFTPEPVYEREFQSAIRTADTTIVQQAGTRVASIASADSAAMDVLVAEDNEVNQRVIQGMLANLGHRCTLASDGRAAVAFARERKFDLILMDIHMPELDGLEAMQEIWRHLGRAACPPIAAMTAHALPGDREHYLNAGMDDYLSKPLRSADLRQLLERVQSSSMATRDASDELASIPRVPAAAPAHGNEADTHIDDVPVLDIEQLQDLRFLPSASDASTAAGDPVDGLIRLFQSKAVERMALMDSLLAKGDWTALSETAHSLRGASASMGFPRVAVLCKELELSARLREGNPAGAPDGGAELNAMLDRIRRHYAEAERALEAWLANAPAVAGAPIEAAGQ